MVETVCHTVMSDVCEMLVLCGVCRGGLVMCVKYCV